MAETDSDSTEKRIAVVTGANKGIGLEICRQLASKGLTVILTARDEKKGVEAVEQLKESGLKHVFFHQLDMTDQDSIASLADFIKTQFGKLDILVNNAGIMGATVDLEALKVVKLGVSELRQWMARNIQQTSEMAEECIKTNYYGTKRVTEALIPLLQATNSARIVNVSSSHGQLKHISNERVREELGDIDVLTEERLDKLLQEFLNDVKSSPEVNGWVPAPFAYRISKAVLNAYMRIQAKRYPTLSILCMCPGFVKTDLTFNCGVLTVEEGAESAVRLALMPDGHLSGVFFYRKEEASF